jgi:hypothetical protein
VVRGGGYSERKRPVVFQGGADAIRRERGVFWREDISHSFLHLVLLKTPHFAKS